MSFGITDEIDEKFLGAISGDILTPTGQQKLGVDYFTAPDFQALSAMNDVLTSTICKSPPPSRCNIPIFMFMFVFISESNISLQINVTNEIDCLLCLCYASSTSVLCSAYDMSRIIHALICTMIFALETDICMMQMLLLNTIIKVLILIIYVT